MIYELRMYEVVPGRMPAMHARFQNHTLGFFAKHGIKVIGFWEAVVGQSNVLNYLLAFDSLAHREELWKKFGGDPEWVKMRSNPELADALIVSNISNSLLRPLPFSPIR